MTPEYRRLLLACRSELEADLANEAWGPEQYARHHWKDKRLVRRSTFYIEDKEG